MQSIGNDSDVIAHLENIVSDVMNPLTPFEQKTRLEQELIQWKQSATANVFPILVQILTTSSNEYLLWFAVTTIEELVARRWTSLRQISHEHKAQIRQFLWDFMLRCTKSTSTSFALRKVRKVLVDIARYEWQSVHHNTWPDFMLSIETLLRDPNLNYLLCGLHLVEVLVDEFGRDNALVFAQVKRHSQAQLKHAFPSLLSSLYFILNACIHNNLQNSHPIVQTIPFGSWDEQDQVAVVILQTIIHGCTWAPLSEQMDIEWFTLIFKVAVNYQTHMETPRGISTSTCASSVSALQALIEIAGKRFKPELLPQILNHVLVCICTLLQATLSAFKEITEMSGQVNKMTIDDEYWTKLCEVVNSFLSQHIRRLQDPSTKHILPDFLGLVAQVTIKQRNIDGFLNCLRVWEVFVGYLEEAKQEEEASNEEVQRVFAAYEAGLVNVMLHIMERMNYASNYEQLMKLDDEEEDNEDDANLTLKTSSLDAVFELNGDNDQRVDSNTPCSLQDLAQAANMVNMANDLETNRTQQSEDSENRTTTELSERKQFIVDCVALVQRIAAFPSCTQPILDHVLSRVEGACQLFLFQIHDKSLPTPQSETWIQERSSVRDLTTNCAVLASVCAQYTSRQDGLSHEQMYTAWKILQLFLALGEYAVEHRLHTRGDAYVELLCEALTCIRVCLSGCADYFLRQQKIDPNAQTQAKQELCKLSERLLQIVLRTLDSTIVSSPHVIMHSALQVLAHLGYIVTYDDLRYVPTMVELEKNIHRFSQSLPLSIQGDLYTAMSNSIIDSAISLKSNYPVAGMSTGAAALQQHWGQAYGSLVLPIREGIETAALILQQNEHRIFEHTIMLQIQRDCRLVCRLAASIETKPKLAKDAFFEAYESIFPALLSLLTTYFMAIRRSGDKAQDGSTTQRNVKHGLEVVNEIIRLYAQLLKSIRKEMQKDRVATIMQTFVSIFEDVQLGLILQQQGTAGVIAICGLLKLLTIVLAEPTTVFAAFVQNILDLCFGPLRQTIFFHAESESVILAYYVSLVEQLFLQHFRFFVVSGTTFNSEGRRDRVFVSDAAKTYFHSLLGSLANILGSSFKVHDQTSPQSQQASSLSPRLCRQVLLTLHRIDEAHNLFRFKGFQEELRTEFMSTLLLVLLNGEMNLLRDELIRIFHRLAGADFGDFYQRFIPSVTKQILTPAQLEAISQQADPCLQWSGQVDLSTFSQELVDFVNDIRVLQAQEPI